MRRFASLPFNPEPAAGREQRSLFGEILDLMLAPLLLLWPMSVVLTALVAQDIANRPYDRELSAVVRSLSQQISVETTFAGEKVADFRLPAGAFELLRSEDEEDRVFYQVLGLRGEFLSGDRDLPVPADEEPHRTGEVLFRDASVNSRQLRVAHLWVAPGAVGNSRGVALVQVAETLGKRSQLTNEIIKGVIFPQFAILPVAVLLVWFALARGIAPLNELQRRIRSRESTDLSPIDEREAPEEVSPLVRAINDLLARLEQSIGAQKHFLNDAAHQMKTPLAGLRTQAELAEREIDAGRRDPASLKRSLQQIARSSQRAAHMVNQLLALARAEGQPRLAQPQEVRLGRLATETVRDFVPRALEKRIDLGYEGPDGGAEQLRVLGHPLLLREAIRNLVDNALQYTPAGGTVTVRLLEDPFGQVVVLQIEDSGPGIAPAEREQVFRPFYRVLGNDADGSGLGLAIVREIAVQHGAQLSLDDANLRPSVERGASTFGVGARFTLRFAAVRNASRQAGRARVAAEANQA